MKYWERTSATVPEGATALGNEQIGDAQVYVTKYGKFLAWVGGQWLSRATIAALQKEAAARVAPVTVMLLGGLTGHYRSEAWDQAHGRYVRDPNATPRPFRRTDLARYERGKWTMANGNRIHDSGGMYAVDADLEQALLALVVEQWALEDRWQALVEQYGKPLSHDNTGAPRFRKSRGTLEAQQADTNTEEAVPMTQ